MRYATNGFATAGRPAILLTLLLILPGCSGGMGMSGGSIDRQDDAMFQAGADRPPSAHTLYRLARLLQSQGKDHESVSILRVCTRRYPEFAAGFAELAGMHVRYRQFGEAVMVLDEGLEFSPDDAVLHNDLGMCWFLQGDYTRALASFERAAELRPIDARYTSNVALATGMLGDYDSALSAYESVMSPGHAHYNLGVICDARDDRDGAAREFEIAASMGVFHAESTTE